MATTNRPRAPHLPIWGSMDHPWPPTTTTTPPPPPLGAPKPTRSARCTKKRRTSQSGSVFYTPKPLRRATARLSGPRYALFVNFRSYSGKEPKNSEEAQQIRQLQRRQQSERPNRQQHRQTRTDTWHAPPLASALSRTRTHQHISMARATQLESNPPHLPRPMTRSRVHGRVREVRRALHARVLEGEIPIEPVRRGLNNGPKRWYPYRYPYS